MILIARCRLGYPCRYHGRAVISPAVIARARSVQYRVICPEMEMGFGTPRPPIRRRKNKYYMAAEDITARINEYVSRTAAKYADDGIMLFIGTKGSPCCDPRAGMFALALARRNIPTRLKL